MTRSKLIAVAVAAVLLVGAAAWWRRAPATPVRQLQGGQIVVSMRGEPRSWNRLVDRTSQAEMLAWLTQARLLRINRASMELEPWLAERWEEGEDGLTYTVHLREDVTWSDGVPFTSADVLFTLEAVFAPGSGAVIGSALTVADRPITATAPDAHTVVFTYPGPSGLGVRLLNNLWLAPRHKLEPALRDGTFGKAWDTRTPPEEVVGLGPFVLREYQPGQRLVLDRNPRYWRRDEDGSALPYLDRIVVDIVTDQNTELLRLTAGDLDLTSSELRPEDYVVARRAAEQGRLRLIDLGVGPDPDAFWFPLDPAARTQDPRHAFVARPEFRQAISHAVNRQRFADVVYLGAAVPIWGPVTPGNEDWYWPDVPKYPYDLDRARALLRSIGLEDRNGNGTVEDARGVEAAFVAITQRGLSHYERALGVIREDLARVGIGIEPAPLELGAMIGRMLKSDFDAIYFRFLLSDLDPALATDFWLSSGSAHVWHMAQASPATDWERRIDALMRQQAGEPDQARRREIFNEVQAMLAEHLPILHFVAPRIYYAHSARLEGVAASPLRPNVLWSADTLRVTGPASSTH